MATFEVQDPRSGVVLELEGDTPPTEEELTQIFDEVNVARVEQRQAGREGLDFTNPFMMAEVPGTVGREVLTPFPRPLGVLQNIGAVAQREEAAVAGPILDIQQGRGLKEAGLSFIQGLTGEEQTQLGDVFTQAGFSDEDARVFGLAASFGLPVNFLVNAFTGGASKGITTTTTKQTVKFFESIANKVSGVTRKTFKKMSELVDKHGVSRIFSPSIENPTYIGAELTPRVTNIIQDKALSMDKQVLKEFFKVEESIVDDIVKRAKDAKVARIPTVSQANQLFDNIVVNAPENIRIPIDEFSSFLDEAVGELGDVPLARSLDKINRRVLAQRSLNDFLTGRGASLNKANYLQLRRDLNLLRRGDEQLTRFVDQAKFVLDNSAEAAGVEGIKNAKAIMTISRQMEKAMSKITKEALDEDVLSKLNRIRDPKNVPTRKLFERLLGKEATDEMFDLIDANQILTAKELAPPAPAGLQGAPRQVSRKAQREFAEKVAPGQRALSRSRLGRTTREAIGRATKLAETGTIRSLISPDE